MTNVVRMRRTAAHTYPDGTAAVLEVSIVPLSAGDPVITVRAQDTDSPSLIIHSPHQLQQLVEGLASVGREVWE